MNLLFLSAANAAGKLAAALAWDVDALRVEALTQAHYKIGATVRLRAVFGDVETPTDPGGEMTLVDPDAVAFSVRDPHGVITELSWPGVINEGVGHYSAVFTASIAGEWAYRVEATVGEWAGAAEGSFIVDRSPFFP